MGPVVIGMVDRSNRLLRIIKVLGDPVVTFCDLELAIIVRIAVLVLLNETLNQQLTPIPLPPDVA